MNIEVFQNPIPLTKKCHNRENMNLYTLIFSKCSRITPNQYGICKNKLVFLQNQWQLAWECDDKTVAHSCRAVIASTVPCGTFQRRGKCGQQQLTLGVNRVRRERRIILHVSERTRALCFSLHTDQGIRIVD